ncbi:MAG: bifunctional precorrin-2 dehydrogenase/sirohydrochlorin ferrochelatase [Lachnospiraceae bacterium]|nr:bifunctional precorrin-2 dehydrogenase/sirohydrochlorin ferrochelatase [Lachnospiraceae bacterium]
MTPYFPMFINLENKKILVVGAGTIATRRIKALMKFGASLRVVAPIFSPELSGLEGVDMINRGYQPEDLEGIDIAVIATDNATLNEEIGKECEERGILKNISSDQSKCDFFFPSTIITDDVVIGINSGGKDPGLTKRTRLKIEKMLVKGGDD